MYLSNSKCPNKGEVGTLTYYVIGREYFRAIGSSRYNAGDDLALNGKLSEGDKPSTEFRHLYESYPIHERIGLDNLIKNTPTSDVEKFWHEDDCSVEWVNLACAIYTKIRFVGGCPDTVVNDPFYAKLYAKLDTSFEPALPPKEYPDPPRPNEDLPGVIRPPIPVEPTKPPEPVGLREADMGTKWWVIGGAVAIAGALIYGVTRK